MGKLYVSVVEYGVQSYPHQEMEYDSETYMGGWHCMRIEYWDSEEPYAFLEHHVWMPPGVSSDILENWMNDALKEGEGWRTGSVDEFLADITTLENEVIRLEDELDKLEAKNKRVRDEMQECHNLLKAPSFDNDGGPTYLPDDIRSLLSIIDALKEGDDAD